MAAPLFYELMMKEINDQLSEVDVDDANPLTKFIESRTFDAAGARAGVAAFASLEKAAYKPPSDENGNPWIQFAKVNSQKIESEWEAPIYGGEHDLAKRLGDSTRRTALTEWIKKCIADGDTVEALAEYAAKNDAAKAKLILEIGETL